MCVCVRVCEMHKQTIARANQHAFIVCLFIAIRNSIKSKVRRRCDQVSFFESTILSVEMTLWR